MTFSSALLPCAWIPAAFAQSAVPETRGGAPRDWSHRHLIFANPDTRDEAARKGTLAFEKWKQKHKDPRFAQQVAKKQRFVEPSEKSGFSPQQLQWYKRNDRNLPATGQEVHRDWSNVLGGVSGVGKAGVFPAKYGASFASADCANDFIVYPTASAGATSTGQLSIWSGALSGQPSAGQTLTITRTGSPDLVLTASAGLNSGFNFQIGTTYTVTATNVANAIARNGGSVGVTATNPSNNVVTISSITAGPNPGITVATTLANITGIVITAGTNAPGQPTIVAFNQIYKGACGTSPTQPVPATFWSYNTGNGALVQTSPVLSLDGTQVAFVQGTGTAGTGATLVLLKWSSAAPGTVGVPTVPTTAATNADYRACSAPCMLKITLSGAPAPANTNSSPYYDYASDTLYVGADNGTLHKFTNVFGDIFGVPTGLAPAEATAPWPVAVSPGNILTSPVYDSVSGLVFVGSKAGAATGGQLHSINAATGAISSSGQLARFNSVGVRDAPIVDSTAKKVYTFVGANLGNMSAVYQFSTASSISNLTTPVVQVGLAVGTSVLYSGAFDNSYWASTTPDSPTGNLYVCGSANATSRRPALWTVPIANNVMGAPVAGPTLVSNTADCSPITEVMNGANDYLFASVTASGNAAGCTGACVYSFQIPIAPISFDTTSTPSTINSNTRRYINISTTAALDTNERNVDTALSAAEAGTYYRMTITQSAASPSGTDFTYVLRSNTANNPANTALNCTIAAGATTCSDTADQVTLTAGALVDVRVERTRGNNSLTGITFRVQLEAVAGVPAPAASLDAPGGTSGIVVDNTAGNGGSQIYYSTIGTGTVGNAVQASQAGLN